MSQIFLLILFSALVGCSSFSKNKDTAQLHHQIGLGHMRTGNYPQALAELIQAEKLDSSNHMIQNSLGLAYYFRGRIDLSERHFRRALIIKSDYSDARNNLSRVLIDLNKYDQAIIEAKKVTEDLTYPNPEKPFLNLGISYFKKNEYEQAKHFLLKAIELSRENCLALSYYGRSLYEQKDYRRAADALDKAVGFCQQNQFDEPHYYSALSYFHLGDVHRSEIRLEEVIKIYTYGKYSEKAKTMLEAIKR